MRGLPLSLLTVVAGTVCSVDIYFLQLIIRYSLNTTGLVAHSCKRVFIHKWLKPRVTTSLYIAFSKIINEIRCNTGIFLLR